MISLSCKYFLYYSCVPMYIRNNLSFVLNHERNYLKIHDVFHFSDFPCYIFFWWKWDIFGLLSLNSKPYPQKSPGMLYTIGFKILSRKWISNFRLPQITSFLLYANYVNTLFKRGEINKSDKKAMRPKSAQITGAHSLLKTYIHEHLLKFRPIKDTINAPYYEIPKFLSNLFNLLAENDYLVQDFFSIAKWVEKYLKYLKMVTDLSPFMYNLISWECF